MSGIVPVTSLAEAIEVPVACGIATDAVPSITFGPELLSDCRPIGVGEVIEGASGAGVAGLAPLSAGDGAEVGGGSLEFSMAGGGGGLPPSSSVIAILKVPSTMTTTLAPTSSERILVVMVEGSLALSALAALSGRPALSTGGAA